MRRQTISASRYAAILSELVVLARHESVMCVTIGNHASYGRVVLLRSGRSYVVIADRLQTSQESYDENHVLQAVVQ